MDKNTRKKLENKVLQVARKEAPLVGFEIVSQYDTPRKDEIFLKGGIVKNGRILSAVVIIPIIDDDDVMVTLAQDAAAGFEADRKRKLNIPTQIRYTSIQHPEKEAITVQCLCKKHDATVALDDHLFDQIVRMING